MPVKEVDGGAEDVDDKGTIRAEEAAEHVVLKLDGLEKGIGPLVDPPPPPQSKQMQR
jgi:hypothetical protein